jgi:hypothetical protein
LTLAFARLHLLLPCTFSSRESLLFVVDLDFVVGSVVVDNDSRITHVVFLHLQLILRHAVVGLHLRILGGSLGAARILAAPSLGFSASRLPWPDLDLLFIFRFVVTAALAREQP